MINEIKFLSVKLSEILSTYLQINGRIENHSHISIVALFRNTQH